jgi:hypothetical protein
MIKQTRIPHMLGIILSAAAVTLSACGLKGKPGPDVILPSGMDSPCDLAEEQVGQQVEVGGEIAFVDDVDPEWLYADLEAEGCRVGIAVLKRTHRTWDEEQQATFTVGAQIQVQGRLASYPMPARPDELQMIVELDFPPQALSEIPALLGTDAPSLMPLIGMACDLSHVEHLAELSIEGEIILVDDTAAAGLYAEFDRDGCSVRLWVERTRWDTWSAGEQSLYAAGETVVVEGILTDVLHEPVLDLSIPPILRIDAD